MLVGHKSRSNNERVDSFSGTKRAVQSQLTVAAITERFKLIEARRLMYRGHCAINAVQYLERECCFSRFDND